MPALKKSKDVTIETMRYFTKLINTLWPIRFRAFRGVINQHLHTIKTVFFHSAVSHCAMSCTPFNHRGEDDIVDPEKNCEQNFFLIPLISEQISSTGTTHNAMSRHATSHLGDLNARYAQPPPELTPSTSFSPCFLYPRSDLLSIIPTASAIFLG